jgi:hypothetical protein
VRDDVAASRRQLVVDGVDAHRPAVGLDPEDVDAVREQPRHDQTALVVRVAEVVELVADVRHVDPVDDRAEVGLARVRADDADEVRVGRALRDRRDVEIPLLLRRPGPGRLVGSERDREHGSRRRDQGDRNQASCSNAVAALPGHELLLLSKSFDLDS